jgi:hypothetical protein
MRDIAQDADLHSRRHRPFGVKYLRAFPGRLEKANVLIVDVRTPHHANFAQGAALD